MSSHSFLLSPVVLSHLEQSWAVLQAEPQSRGLYLLLGSICMHFFPLLAAVGWHKAHGSYGSVHLVAKTDVGLPVADTKH